MATKLNFGSSEGITGEKDRTKVPESKESKAENGNSNTGSNPTSLELLRTCISKAWIWIGLAGGKARLTGVTLPDLAVTVTVVVESEEVEEPPFLVMTKMTVSSGNWQF